MGVTLFVGPLVDEDGEEEYVEQGRALLADFNAKLEALGLPPYVDAAPTEDNSPFWSTMFGNACLGYLHVLLSSLQENEAEAIALNHFIDPTFFSIRYLPVDFPEPIECKLKGEDENVDEESLEDMIVFGSCQALVREIEQVAAWLEIPLDRFPIDYSGDGSEMEPTWARVIDELEENDARCMKLRWSPIDADGAMEQARAFCEMTGIPLDEFLTSITEEHGSLEAFINSQNEADITPEEKSASVIVALVNHYHAARMAIEHNLAFQIGGVASQAAE